MATPVPGWKSPEPPVPGAVLAFEEVDGNIDLFWYDPLSGDQIEGHDVPWPFIEDRAEFGELADLGFVNVEDLPFIR